MIIGQECGSCYCWQGIFTKHLGSAMVPVVARKSHHPGRARSDLWLLLGVSGTIGLYVSII